MQYTVDDGMVMVDGEIYVVFPTRSSKQPTITGSFCALINNVVDTSSTTVVVLLHIKRVIPVGNSKN